MKRILFFILCLLAANASGQSAVGIPAAQLPVATNAAGNDLVVIYKYPFTANTTRQLSFSNFLEFLSDLPRWEDLTSTSTNTIITTNGLSNPLTENLDFDGWLATNVFGLRPQVGETIEIVNAVIDGTFTGNGQGLTNLYASTNLEVVVSGRGIANGLSTRVNDGKQYGPDTAGTTTGGFQEAWNDSLAGENLYGPRSAAVSIVIDGLVFFTNQLALSNQFTTAVSIRGNNPINDMLVYAGSNSGISCITIRGGAMPPAGSLLLIHDVRLRGFGVTAINDNTNVLLTITNYSHGEIIGMNFTSWMARTNQAWGAGTSLVGDGLIPRSSSLVGLVIGNGGENGTVIANNNFGHLGVGLHIADADHIYAENNTFSLIAFGETEFTNRWPASHSYSMGASIMGRVGINWRFDDSYFYECTGECFFLQNSSSANPPLFINRAYTESADRFVSAQYTNTQIVYITGEVPAGALFARATNSGGIWTRVSQEERPTTPMDVRRMMYENNRDQVSDAWRLVYANKLEVSGDHYHGSGLGLSNYAASVNSGATTVLRPVPGISTSTNQFFIFGSGTNDGFWSWNSTSQSYTNPLWPGTAAISEQILTPGVNRITLTNAFHNDLGAFDYVLTTWQWRLTNITAGMWADVDDAIQGIYGWWATPTNQTAVFDGMQGKLQLLGTHESTGPGTIDYFDDLNVIYAIASNITVRLPPAATNNGRFIFVKNQLATNTQVVPNGLGTQLIDQRASFVLTNFQASAIFHAWSNTWWTLSLDEGVGVGGGSGTSPGGGATTLQFNDGGVFGGDNELVWNKTTDILTVNGAILTGDIEAAGFINGNGQNITDINATNISNGVLAEPRLHYSGTDPAAGLVLTSTSSNTPAWLAPTGGAGDGIATLNGTGTNTYLKNVTFGGLGLFATNGAGDTTFSASSQLGTLTVTSFLKGDELRLPDDDASAHEIFQAPGVMASNLTWIFPALPPVGTQGLLVTNNNDGTIGVGYAPTNLNASALTAGEIPDARYGGTIELTNNSFPYIGFEDTGDSQYGTITFSGASDRFEFSKPIAADGSGLTTLNASALTSGTVPDARLGQKTTLSYTGDSTNVFWDGYTYAEAILLLTNHTILNMTNAATPSGFMLPRKLLIVRTGTTAWNLYVTNTSSPKFGTDITGFNIGPNTNSSAWAGMNWNSLSNRWDITGNPSGY